MKPELLAPAGSPEKLRFAYRYGADAAYIGVAGLSLRSRAESIADATPMEIEEIKGDRRLYGALNIYFHDEELKRLETIFGEISAYPFDAFIVSDPGAARLLRRLAPDTPLHLSTQANCINSESARMYRDLGYRRLILGRELSLQQIEAIRRSVPDVELEVFVHGAMCIAYSGRCYLSKYLAGRSGNEGDCAHTCRWEYRVLEEAKRPGEYLPIIDDGRFTTILSSKDLCMFDHLGSLIETGIDSLKIEGRMKSLSYTAATVGAYRAAIEAAMSGKSGRLDFARGELDRISHRAYCTGFYFGDEASVAPTDAAYERQRLFLGTLGTPDSTGRFPIDVKNQITEGMTIEFLTPGFAWYRDSEFKLFDEAGNRIERAIHGSCSFLSTRHPVEADTIVRTETPGSNPTEAPV